MLQHMSGGQWGLVTRRIFEAGTRLLPYCLVLFIPVAVFAPKLYLWAQPEVVSGDEILKFKAPYLNVTVLAHPRGGATSSSGGSARCC